MKRIIALFLMMALMVSSIPLNVKAMDEYQPHPREDAREIEDPRINSGLDRIENRQDSETLIVKASEREVKAGMLSLEEMECFLRSDPGVSNVERKSNRLSFLINNEVVTIEEICADGVVLWNITERDQVNTLKYDVNTSTLYANEAKMTVKETVSKVYQWENEGDDIKSGSWVLMGSELRYNCYYEQLIGEMSLAFFLSALVNAVSAYIQSMTGFNPSDFINTAVAGAIKATTPYLSSTYCGRTMWYDRYASYRYKQRVRFFTSDNYNAVIAGTERTQIILAPY